MCLKQLKHFSLVLFYLQWNDTEAKAHHEETLDREQRSLSHESGVVICCIKLQLMS